MTDALILVDTILSIVFWVKVVTFGVGACVLANSARGMGAYPDYVRQALTSAFAAGAYALVCARVAWALWPS